MNKKSEVIRVLLVDDHEMVRRGLSTFLEAFSDLELVGEASNGVEALDLCGNNHPNVILMDLVMPEMDGVEATRQITKKFPDVRVIALTSFEDQDNVQAALKAGAISFLHKNISIDDLGEAIRKAHIGQTTLSPEATQAVVTAATQQPKPGQDLTSREGEVLAQLILGLTNPEIAKKLTISRSTVKTHVSSILSKLGASNRLEAVTLAIKHDLIH